MGKPHHPGRRGKQVNLQPLTMDAAVEGFFKIAPADVKKIIDATSRKKKKKSK